MPESHSFKLNLKLGQLNIAHQLSDVMSKISIACFPCQIFSAISMNRNPVHLVNEVVKSNRESLTNILWNLILGACTNVNLLSGETSRKSCKLCLRGNFHYLTYNLNRISSKASFVCNSPSNVTSRSEILRLKNYTLSNIACHNLQSRPGYGQIHLHNTATTLADMDRIEKMTFIYPDAPDEQIDSSSKSRTAGESKNL